MLLLGCGYAISITDAKSADGLNEKEALTVSSNANVRGGLGGYHGIKGFGGNRAIGKRDAEPRSPGGFAVGGFQSVPPSRPIKGGGLGGYHGFKGFGGVHAIGTLPSFKGVIL